MKATMKNHPCLFHGRPTQARPAGRNDRRGRPEQRLRTAGGGRRGGRRRHGRHGPAHLRQPARRPDHELKAGARIREQLGSSAHVSVNSYNRVALATGEVSSEADRQAIERIVAGVENVQRVMNETAVMEASSLKSRSNDVWISSQIKAKLVDARDLFSNAYDVVVTRARFT